MVVRVGDDKITNAGFLPIVAAYAERIGLVEEIDRLLDCKMEVSPGRVVLAMVLDVLSGRSPLFRLQESFADKDIELLLGEDMPLSKLTDHTMGRVLERLAHVGTHKVLGAIALRVMKSFDLDLSHAHHDTTSQSVYGEYRLYERENHRQPFVITEGYSKDHRPDLKQLIHSLLCVDHGIPIYSKVQDGNASDKTINKNLIPEMVKRMRELGQEDFIYVADSALVTKDNLKLINDWRDGFLFVSRLPLTYGECQRAIATAVTSDTWKEIGPISDQAPTKNRKPASYRAFETTVTLYGICYRAVVVHSDAHDERRQKKVNRQIQQDLEQLAKAQNKLEKIDYACLADAQAAARRLPTGTFHHLHAQIQPLPRYGNGRPRATEPRRIKEMRYGLKLTIQVDDAALQKAREEAGCFILLTNTKARGPHAVPARKLLTVYKDQHMVEQNFGFLKDPIFVNALFLKSPRRIEALGLILVLALMIWRLMERTMRRNLTARKTKITGWANRQTSRPTSLMMTSKFVAVFVIISQGHRRLGNPLDQIQLEYLSILDLGPGIYLTSHHKTLGAPLRE